MKFFYLRDKVGKLVGCVVSQRIVSENFDVIAYAVSACNFKFDKFTKTEARHYAVKNLDKAFFITTQPGVKRRILMFISDSQNFPNRARKAADLWLKQHPIVN